MKDRARGCLLAIAVSIVIWIVLIVGMATVLGKAENPAAAFRTAIV